MPDTIDAHLPEPGDLLYVINPTDSRGDPTWAHDFVMLGRFERGAPSAGPPNTEMVLACLGVSSITASRPFNPKRMVRLRHGPPPAGDVETGLVAPCAVQIDWPELVPIQRLQGKTVLQAVGVRWNKRQDDSRRRHIDEQTLAAIYRKIEEYAAGKRG